MFNYKEFVVFQNIVNNDQGTTTQQRPLQLTLEGNIMQTEEIQIINTPDKQTIVFWNLAYI